MKRTALRRVSNSPTAIAKRRIQALLREIVIKRDGGCVIGTYFKTNAACNTPLQAEHLITRSNSATFGDTRNIVCLCQYHHIFWKPQHSRAYWELIEEIVGPIRWAWLELAEADRSPHKVDWVLTELALKNELALLK